MTTGALPPPDHVLGADCLSQHATRPQLRTVPKKAEDIYVRRLVAWRCDFLICSATEELLQFYLLTYLGLAWAPQ